MLKKELLHFLKKENPILKDANLSLREIYKVKKILSIGGGPIGVGWTAHFLSKGFKVSSYIHSDEEETIFKRTLKAAWKTLKSMNLNDKASIRNLEIFTNLEDSILDVDFIQESVPERLSIKAELFQKLGKLVNPEVVIASITSGTK